MAWAQVKKPYVDYDLCPRPMAWAQVKKPYADYDLGGGGGAFAAVLSLIVVFKFQRLLTVVMRVVRV